MFLLVKKVTLLWVDRNNEENICVELEGVETKLFDETVSNLLIAKITCFRMDLRK